MSKFIYNLLQKVKQLFSNEEYDEMIRRIYDDGDFNHLE